MKTMTKRVYPLLSLCLLLGGCQSLEQLSVDYMVPADISFPATLRRVAIVNNVPDRPADENQTAPKAGTEEAARLVRYYNVDPVLATESLAQAIADENYFDEVIICDSALRGNDVAPRETTLSKKEVVTLTRQLKADFLIAIEGIRMEAVRKIEPLPPYNAYLGTVNLTVCPTIRIYTPNRSTPVAALTPSDSIYWENIGNGTEYVEAHFIREEDMVREASVFAGTVPVKHLLPYWTTKQRYLFVGGSVNMRDAAVYARERNWTDAVALWEKEYGTKKGKRKMYAAYNLALGYEMQDSIQSALSWARKAQAAASEIDRVEEKATVREADAGSVPHYLLASMYVAELEKRLAGLHMLDVQTSRFSEE